MHAARQDKKMTHTWSLGSSNLQLNRADKLAHSVVIQDRFIFWKGRGGSREGIKGKKKTKKEEGRGRGGKKQREGRMKGW